MATVTYVPQEQIQRFRELQELPYDIKINYAIGKAQEFYEELDGKVFCSVGGLDSITLLLFLRKYVDPAIIGVTISSLEDKTVQAVHRSLDNMLYLKPYKTKVQVIRDHGYPVISKEKAGKIQLLQNPTEKNSTVRHAIMTGETGAYGGWRKGTKMRLPQKWLDLFGGPENEAYGTNYQTAPFRVSPDCCYHMKEKPANDFAKKTGNSPYMGLMASEGGQREKALIKNGCNYYGKTTVRSCPFAIFQRQDVLQLALDLEAPVPEIYGEIVRDEDGTLRTTMAQRTGCTMCGFGIHIENRPHRFDRLRITNYKEWRFWMYDMGWGKVLDYIGVKWEDEYQAPPEQINLDFAFEEDE
jgi:3'-phosphoadenosine 5'-phosphosulfate sulfotransferase (PAPS reductase)/FAD synthetase